MNQTPTPAQTDLTPAKPGRSRSRVRVAAAGALLAGAMVVTGVLGGGAPTSATQAVPAAGAGLEMPVITVDPAADENRQSGEINRSGERMPVASAAPVSEAPAVPVPAPAPATTAPATTAPAPAPSTTAAKPTAAVSSSASAKPAAASTTAAKAAATTAAAAAAPAAGGSYPACASGSAVESGLTAGGINVHRAICNNFSFVTSYGGYRAGDAEHGTGRAVDAMCSGANGQQLANWLVANASSLGVIEVIYAQKIWTRQRASEGWRAMADRGSVTANHFDHVHVFVNY